MNREYNSLHGSIWIKALALLVVSANLARGQTIPTLDLSFKPVFTRAGGFLSAITVQSDGKIIVAGGFSAINGTARNGLARLNTDGTIDGTFDPGSICCGVSVSPIALGSAISALILQKDNKLIIGGSFTNVNGTTRNGLARLNSDGSLDSSFDPGTGLTLTAPSQSIPPVAAFVLQPDGKILVGGYFTAVNGVDRKGVVRLAADGSLDTTFDPGSALAIADPTDSGRLAAMALLPNGQILIAGDFRSFNAVLRNGLARLNADGTLDPALDVNIGQQDSPPSIDGLLLQPDGGMLISGSFNFVDPEVRVGLARIKPDGKADSAFNPVIDFASGETFRLLALQADGKIIAEHQFTDSGGTSHQAIVRLNADSSLDSSLALDLLPGQSGRIQVAGVAFQSDGKMLVAGDFHMFPNGTLEALVRVDSSGHPDAFAPHFESAGGGNANVLAVATQADGKVLVGGNFNRVNGQEQVQLARLNLDGSLDSSFAPTLPDIDPQSAVTAIRVEPDGKILIGGSFTNIDGANHAGIARLNVDGTLDTTFDVGTGTGGTGSISTFAKQPDGKLLLAGDFSQLNEIPLPWVGRLNTNGSVDLTFSVSFGNCADCDTPQIRGLGVLTNGFIMMSGNFSRVDAFTMNGLARLRPDGSADFSFTSPVPAGGQVSAMTFSSDGKSTVAILTDDASGNGSHTQIVRLNPDGTSDTGFTSIDVIGPDSAILPVSAMALDSQGRLLIAGQFNSVGGIPRHTLARIKTDGTLDNAFDAGPDLETGISQTLGTSTPLVTGIGLQDNGGIVLGGRFGAVGGSVRLGLVRYQADQSGSGGGDGGGNGGTGSVTIQSPARGADGTFSMSVLGKSGQTYQVQASSDLISWMVVGPITGSETPVAFTDPGASALPRRFYRVVGQ